MGLSAPAAAAGPKFRAGRWYRTNPNLNAAPSDLSLVADRLYVAQLYVGQSVAIDRIGVWMTAAGTTGSVLRFGIYRDNGGPGALVSDLGTLSATTGTNVLLTKTISAILPAGLAWLGVSGQGGPVTQPILKSNQSSMTEFPIDHGSSDPVAFSGLGGLIQANISGAFPDPFVRGGASGPPVMWVRAA